MTLQSLLNADIVIVFLTGFYMMLKLQINDNTVVIVRDQCGCGMARMKFLCASFASRLTAGPARKNPAALTTA